MYSKPVLDILSTLEDSPEEPQASLGAVILDHSTDDAEALEMAQRLSVVVTDLLKALHAAIHGH